MRTSFLTLAALLLAACGGGGPSPSERGEAPIVAEAPSAASGAQPAATAGTRLTILYTNNVDGEIEPCG